MDLKSIESVIQTVHRLRAPGGCPWDRKQTHQSLRPYLIEEAYEVLEVLDQVDSLEALKREDIRNRFQEELGDLLMQVLIHSEIAREEGAFDFSSVAQSLNDKLIRRHPHVFGNHQAGTPEEALRNWEAQKAAEKASNPKASVLDGIPNHLPALQRADRTIEKVTAVGFQWENIQGPIQKLREELGEFEAIVQSSKDPKKLEDELGDVLFCLCNIAFHLKLRPENALRSTLNKFRTRFEFVEQKMKAHGDIPGKTPLEVLDRYWEEAKSKEPA